MNTKRYNHDIMLRYVNMKFNLAIKKYKKVDDISIFFKNNDKNEIIISRYYDIDFKLLSKKFDIYCLLEATIKDNIIILEYENNLLDNCTVKVNIQ